MSDTPQRRFELGPCLGRGGYGEVYRADLISPGGLSSVVAVKLVRSDLAVPPDALARLRDEARLLARLQHPNVVRLLDLCLLTLPDGGSRIALVTELVEGRDLGALAGERLPERAAAEVIGRVAQALAAAWDAPGPDGRPLRVVHRDVKPSNIVVGRHGEVRLLDFGISAFEGDSREARTATAELVGTLPFLAPERFVERAAKPPCDVFALGATWFELLSGEAWFAPIPSRTLPALVTDRDRYESWRWARLDRISTRSRDVIAPMLAWDAVSRPTAAEVAAQAEELLSAAIGVSLRAWCRDRDWTPPTVTGELEGRALTEQTSAPPPRAPTPPPVAPRVVRLAQPTFNPEAAPSPAPPRPRVERPAPAEPVLEASGTLFVRVPREEEPPPSGSPISAPPVAEPVVAAPVALPAPRAGLWGLGCGVAAVLGGVVVTGVALLAVAALFVHFG